MWYPAEWIDRGSMRINMYIDYDNYKYTIDRVCYMHMLSIVATVDTFKRGILIYSTFTLLPMTVSLVQGSLKPCTLPSIAPTCSNSIFHMRLPKWRQCEIFSLRYLFGVSRRVDEPCSGPDNQATGACTYGYQENRGNMNPSGVAVVIVVRLPWHLNLVMSHQKLEHEHEHEPEIRLLWSLRRVLNVVLLILSTSSIEGWPSWNFLDDRERENRPLPRLPFPVRPLPAHPLPINKSLHILFFICYSPFGLKTLEYSSGEERNGPACESKIRASLAFCYSLPGSSVPGVGARAVIPFEYSKSHRDKADYRIKRWNENLWITSQMRSSIQECSEVLLGQMRIYNR